MDPLPQASYSHVTLEEPAATGSSPMTVTARRYPTPEEGLLRLSRIEGAFKRSSWHRVGAFYSQYRGHSPCDENNRGWIVKICPCWQLPACFPVKHATCFSIIKILACQWRRAIALGAALQLRGGPSHPPCNVDPVAQVLPQPTFKL